MTENFWLGLIILFVSGLLNASFPVPLKYARTWKWENSWLAFTSLALLIGPIVLAEATVPNLSQVYARLPFSDFLPAVIFGFLWGTAQVTFGLAFGLVGMAMAFAIVVGMGAFIGSFTVMAVLHPGDLLAARGLTLIGSAVILVIGLVLYARAGRRREADAGIAATARQAYRKGLVICLYTGLMGAMINLGFAFSGKIVDQATALGATRQTANYAVWLPVLAAGYIPNLAYTLWLLRRNRTFNLFAATPTRESVLAVLTAFFWLSGTMGYGAGATVMGRFGTSIGYAIYVTVLLLWSTTLGILTGEWKNASPPTVRLMRWAIGFILFSVLGLSATGFL